MNTCQSSDCSPDFSSSLTAIQGSSFEGLNRERLKGSLEHGPLSTGYRLKGEIEEGALGAGCPTEMGGPHVEMQRRLCCIAPQEDSEAAFLVLSLPANT